MEFTKSPPTPKSKAKTKAKARQPRPEKPKEPEYHGKPLSALLDRIADGESVASISRELKVSRQACHQWLIANGGKAYEDAQVLSADGLMDRAEDAILDESLDIARARELANHFRHVAKARAPRKYGDKLHQEVTGKDGAPLVARIESVNPNDAAKAYAEIIKGG